MLARGDDTHMLRDVTVLVETVLGHDRVAVVHTNHEEVLDNGLVSLGPRAVTPHHHDLMQQLKGSFVLSDRA